MKKVVYLFFLGLFLLAPASIAFARDGHGGGGHHGGGHGGGHHGGGHHGGGHHGGRHHGGHHGGGHHGGGHHYSLYWNLNPYPSVWDDGYYGRPYPYYSYPSPVYYPPAPVYYPPASTPPPPIEAEEREVRDDVVEDLRALRKKAVEDYADGKGIPYIVFDTMSPTSRRAYGIVWDAMEEATEKTGMYYEKSRRRLGIIEKK